MRLSISRVWRVHRYSGQALLQRDAGPVGIRNRCTPGAGHSIVDEVLAVGDAAFQKKCLGKMEQVARHGRTVLFVSHNMVAVQELCDRGILLTNGRVAATGTSAEVVAMYLESLEKRGDGRTFTA